MIERPWRWERTRPAPLSTLRLADKVFGFASMARAMSPAAMPSGPAFTKSRKVSRRLARASADRAAAAVSISIVRRYWQYGRDQARAWKPRRALFRRGGQGGGLDLF